MDNSDSEDEVESATGKVTWFIGLYPPKAFDQDRTSILVSNGEEDEVEVERFNVYKRETTKVTSVRPSIPTIPTMSTSSSLSSPASSYMKRKNPSMDSNQRQTPKKAMKVYETPSLKEGKNGQSSNFTSNARPRVISSPPPLPTNLPTSAPEGLQYSIVNQRIHWVLNDVDVGLLFRDYKQRRRGSMDIALDDIIDFTTTSPFLNQLGDEAFDTTIADLPVLADESCEISELTSLLGDVSTYEVFQERVFNIAPNTPIRR
ncbi:hypothetical protein BGZ76_005709, partial [Entomortierella beljakovae]